MHNDPENTICNKLSELRRLVDLDRDEAKQEIDRLADGIVNELNAFESEFKLESKPKTNSDDYESINEKMSKKLSDYEKCLNSLGYSDEHRNNSSKEISKAIDVLNNEIKEYENILFKYKTIEYEPIKNVINFNNIFGKLLVNRNKLFFFDTTPTTTTTTDAISPFFTGFSVRVPFQLAQPTLGTTIKFSPFQGYDLTSKNGFTQTIYTALQSISAMKDYERKSLEELRWEDYQANRKFPAQQSFQFETSSFSQTPANTFFIGGSTSDLFNRSQLRSIFGSPPTSDRTSPLSTGGICGGTSTTATTRGGIFDSVEPKPS